MAAVGALILITLVGSSYREWSLYRDAHGTASRSSQAIELLEKVKNVMRTTFSER
jgi:hypothetical protein